MLDKIAEEGMTPIAICKSSDRYPTERTFFRWLQQYPEFCQEYVKARSRMYERWEDVNIDIADDCTPDSAHVKKAQLQISTRQWNMSRRAPRKYGDRTILAGDADNPISFVDLMKKANGD